MAGLLTASVTAGLIVKVNACIALKVDYERFFNSCGENICSKRTELKNFSNLW